MLSMDRSTALLILATGLTGVSSYCLIQSYRKHKQRDLFSRPANSHEEVPRAWKQIGHVTEIVIYPLKAGYHLSVDRAVCDEKGLRELTEGFSLSDRCFLLFDRRRGTYISNHKYSQLIRVKVAVLSEKLIQFSVHNDASVAPFPLDMAPLVELNAHARSVHTITMYEKDTVRAQDCGDAASHWFSAFLTGSRDDDIRLGYSCGEQRRLNGTVYERYRHFYGRHISNQDMGRFSYFASYMLMNEASVRDLNRRLREKGEPPVSIHNFRGNIIVSTPTCYEEDTWSWVRLRDDVTLRVMKPCTRCKMTCLDPHTGRANPHLEPLQTLRSYRGQLSEEASVLEKASPRLGLYCGLYERGVVQVGDPVYVEDNLVRRRAGDPVYVEDN